jgi:biotin transport system substrate-specific component
MRLLTSVVLIAVFAGLMAVCAQISIPMVPVPMTMQTFAVLLAGAVLGPWRGTAAVLTYLALAALGLPILSDGASGLAPFSGPTVGYLFAFPVAALFTGLLFEKARGVVAKFALLLAAHVLILSMGAGWLATDIGLADAIAYGATPFLIGMAIKSALVVGVTASADRLRPTRD